MRTHKTTTSPHLRDRYWAQRITVPVLVLLLFIVVSSVGYCFFDSRYTFVEALYMTVITVTTIGYREIHPSTFSTMLWTIFVVIGGLLSGATVMSVVVAMIVEGRIRRVFGRRQLQRRIAGLNNHVIVCGFGRMGSLVASELTKENRSIVVIDDDPDRTEVAGATSLLYILGDAQDEDTLKAAGIDRAQVVVASLPTDAENVFITLTARGMNPKVRIIARAQDANSEYKLLRAGANRVICPYTLGAKKMANVVLRPAVVDFSEAAGQGVEIEMDQIALPSKSKLIGKTLQELGLPKRVGVQVVAIQRSTGETMYQPAPDSVLAAGDVLVVVGRGGSVAAVEKLETVL